MIYLLLALLIGAMYHYIVETILGPSLRACLRFDLFRLRDRLRAIRSEGRLDRETFDYVHEFLNTAIRIVPAISISALEESRRAIEADPDLRRSIDDRLARLESLSDVQARDLAMSACRLVYKSLLVNCSGWFILLIPIGVVVVSIQQAYDLIKRMLTIPESEISNMLPTSFGSLST